MKVFALVKKMKRTKYKILQKKFNLKKLIWISIDQMKRMKLKVKLALKKKITNLSQRIKSKIKLVLLQFNKIKLQITTTNFPRTNKNHKI